MRKPLGIIFDFADTLLEQVFFDIVAGNRRMLELADAHAVTIEQVKAVADKVTGWIEPIKSELMVELTFLSLNRLIYTPLDLTFSLGPDELEKEFWRVSLKYAPVPGIYKLLDLLEENDIKTGILSNSMYCAATQKMELEKHHLAHRFSFIVTSADYGVRKPHPFIFNVAVKKIGLAPADVWFVGDTPGQDIKGALNAGLYPVWLNLRDEPRALDGDYLEVAGLDELRKAVEKLV